MGCVKAAERLGRIGAMWLGAERACIWVATARVEGWVRCWSDVRSGCRFGVCGVVSRMAFVRMRDVDIWCGVLVCGDGSMWTWGW
jgi:hypothetical protein